MVAEQKIVDLLTKHEGFRASCYRDTRGFLTVGIGFNLDAPGAADHCAAAGLGYAALRAGQAITLEQAQALLIEGIIYARDMAIITIAGLMDMPEPVQLVVIDMIFNMGRAKFQTFHRMIECAEARDWTGMIREMRASLWCGQVGTRATNDIDLVLSVL